MLIQAALHPAEIALLPATDLRETTCVVFDVLRATSCMITGLAHGVAAIYPVRTIEEALEKKTRRPEALLGGERLGERITGFDLGNAPHEYLDLAGRTIISTTTNGTIALRACEKARRVLVGALLNLEALAAELRENGDSSLLFVCAGTNAEFALEDALAAGYLIEALPDAELSDSAWALRALARENPDPLSTLLAARNGRALSKRGRQAEVEWCAQRSLFSTLGVMENGAVRTLGACSAVSESAG